MTKDEFISKYHTQKVLKFEPPTWEEFLATRDENTFAHWFCEADIQIIMLEANSSKGIGRCPNEFEIMAFDNKMYKSIPYSEVMFGWDMRVEAYYEALDIAKKWFLGEEE